MQREMIREQEEGAGGGGDEAQSGALVDVLRSVLHPEHVWREHLNARWVVFVRHAVGRLRAPAKQCVHGEQTYCLLPLQYEAPVVP